MWIQYESPLDNLQKNGTSVLLKTTLFRQFQIAQTRAQTPTQIQALSPFSNVLVILAEGEILKVKRTTLQTDLAKGHDIKKSILWTPGHCKKPNFVPSVHHLLMKLSVVSNTYLVA
jgi:hypothetical protein